MHRRLRQANPADSVSSPTVPTPCTHGLFRRDLA
jgi:hypothetical protein